MFPGYELADQREPILPCCFKQSPYMTADSSESVTLFFEQRLEFVLPEGTLYDQPTEYRSVTELKGKVIFR